MMQAGDACTVNSAGDLFMLFEARPFIGAHCVYVKTTKAGLAQVALSADPRRTLSVPLRNVDVLAEKTCDVHARTGAGL